MAARPASASKPIDDASHDTPHSAAYGGDRVIMPPRIYGLLAKSAVRSLFEARMPEVK